MASVIVCPSCQTRYETAAVIPPEGRKVRCSKCGHVWQATAVVDTPPPPPPPQLRPSPAMAPRAPVSPAAAAAGATSRIMPGASIPRPGPAAPAAPAMAPRAQPMRAPVPPPETRSEPQAPVNANPLPGFGGFAARQPNGSGQDVTPPFSASGDAAFDAPEDFQPDVTEPGQGAMASMGGDWSQDLGSYNAGSLVPDSLGQTNVPITKSKVKVPPVVAIGWGVLALLLAILGALFALSPKTMVSIMPSTAKLYAMMGSPVNLSGLDIQDVRYSWEHQVQGPVLKVEGHVVNVSGDDLTVPPVVVSLQDASGSEVTAVTTEVGPLAPGTSAPFAAEIPSPAGVTNLRVRFAEAS